MSTSILYHCFGVMGRGIRYVHTRYENGCAVFRIDKDPTSFRCSCCGSRDVRKKGTVRRVWNALPVGLRPTLIEWFVQRVLCPACGSVRQVEIPFAHPERRYTGRFERYALDLSKRMTISAVARTRSDLM